LKLHENDILWDLVKVIGYKPNITIIFDAHDLDELPDIITNRFKLKLNLR